MSLWSNAKNVLLEPAVNLSLGIIVGLTMGWMLWSPSKQTAEVYAPEIRNVDQSLVLEKSPQANAKPAQQVPRGAVVERIVYVKVQPHGPSDVAPTATLGSSKTALPPMPCGLPSPIRVDLTLYRLIDGTRRVVASSPDGLITGGMDIPVSDAPQKPKELSWAVGGVCGASTRGAQTYGVFVDKDFKFIRAGIELTKSTGITYRPDWELRAKLGLRF